MLILLSWCPLSERMLCYAVSMLISISSGCLLFSVAAMLIIRAFLFVC